MPSAKKSTAASKPSTSTRRPARAARSSSASEKARANLKSSLPTASIFTRLWRPVAAAVAVALVLGLAVTWYTKVFADPTRVFWGMVGNNLSTASVTRQTTQPTCVQINATMQNVIRISFAPSLRLHCLTDINQGTTNLTIESIGTTQADYERYSNIESAATGSQKYSSVYNLWLKNNGQQNAKASLYSQLLTDPVLFANLTAPERKSIVGQLHKAYDPHIKSVRRDTSGSRRTYTYSVDIALKQFAQAEKDYADMLNLPLAQRINPANYKPGQKVSLSFTVDVLSRQLRQVSYQQTTEDYSGYGLQTWVNVPAKTVSDAQLQNAFKAANAK